MYVLSERETVLSDASNRYVPFKTQLMMGYSVMVAQGTLTPYVCVRFTVPQPIYKQQCELKTMLT